MFNLLQSPKAHVLKLSAEMPHVNLLSKDTHLQPVRLSFDVSIFYPLKYWSPCHMSGCCSQKSQKSPYPAFMLLSHVKPHHFIIYICLRIKSYYKHPDGGFRASSLSPSLSIFTIYLKLVNVPGSLVRKENEVPWCSIRHPKLDSTSAWAERCLSLLKVCTALRWTQSRVQIQATKIHVRLWINEALYDRIFQKYERFLPCLRLDPKPTT